MLILTCTGLTVANGQDISALTSKQFQTTCVGD
ncbi:unknown [[Mannheimia] succiniciproducens MBEL55E]|uniref:Uncharacterized protein n=1 Tax=Mannheimia succiniciproducens (strain KCTC 0769BP / MBEL55E) TaxID=221988 RepID=Q65WD7_MANSM|nr:unknown [[Mannheimia] succiniciproducens MBEL55E]